MADETKESPAPESAPADPAAAELKEFQKLTDPAERKKYWQTHPSIQAVYAGSNFS